MSYLFGLKYQTIDFGCTGVRKYVRAQRTKFSVWQKSRSKYANKTDKETDGSWDIFII